MRPNVVLFVSHDTGRFVSPYGHATVETPHFERLASSSVMFTNAYCTSPLCAPSRAAIVTGQPPHQNGMNGLPGPFLGDWDMAAKERHLAAVFSRSGYTSVLAGFEHESQDCRSLGFQDVIHGSGDSHNGGESLAGIGADIGAWLVRKGPEPFYMQIGCFETHRDWSSFASPYDSKGIWKAPYLIDDPEIDQEMALMIHLPMQYHK